MWPTPVWHSWHCTHGPWPAVRCPGAKKTPYTAMPRLFSQQQQHCASKAQQGHSRQPGRPPWLLASLSSRSATSSSAEAFLRCAVSRSWASSCINAGWVGRWVDGWFGGRAEQSCVWAASMRSPNPGMLQGHCPPLRFTKRKRGPCRLPAHLLLRRQRLLLRAERLELPLQPLEPLPRLCQLIEHAALLVGGRRLLPLQLRRTAWREGSECECVP